MAFRKTSLNLLHFFVRFSLKINLALESIVNFNFWFSFSSNFSKFRQFRRDLLNKVPYL
jgi:hypothetical protein